MKNFAEFLEEKCQFYRERLKHLSSEQFFSPSFVPEDSVMIPDFRSYYKMDGVYAKKENWRKKIDRLMIEGFSEISLQSIFSAAKEEEASYYLLGKIYFKSSLCVTGEISFLRKYVDKTPVKEFLVSSYRINFKGMEYEMPEISSSWEQGVNLVALSLIDFERNPEVFIKERIIDWKQKQEKVTA